MEFSATEAEEGLFDVVDGAQTRQSGSNGFGEKQGTQDSSCDGTDEFFFVFAVDEARGMGMVSGIARDGREGGLRQKLNEGLPCVGLISNDDAVGSFEYGGVCDAGFLVIEPGFECVGDVRREGRNREKFDAHARAAFVTDLKFHGEFSEKRGSSKRLQSHTICCEMSIYD